MKKIGLLGRWAEFPPTGLTFNGSKPRTITISFNTTDRVAVYAADSWWEELEVGRRTRETPPTLLGIVDGLEVFEFRCQGDAKLALAYDGDARPAVWYQTSEGENYAIDAEHLRDFTVPMLGRRSRDPEQEAFRYEMRQQMAQYGALFAQFMAMQKASGNVHTPSPEQADQEPSANNGTADSAGDTGNVRSGAAGDAERKSPENGDVSASAREGDAGRSPSGDTGIRAGDDKANGPSHGADIRS